MSTPDTINAMLRLKAKNEQLRLEFVKLPLYKKIYRLVKDRAYMSYLYWTDYDRYIKYKRLGDVINEINSRNLTTSK